MSEQTRSPIGVIIADDHEVVRLGLRMTIAGEPDMRLLGEARTGHEALALASSRDTARDQLALAMGRPVTRCATSPRM